MNPLLLPVVAVQGAWVRLTTESVPPATGSSSGTAPGGPGTSLRLAVVGESTAAGCGVDIHENGFAGCLARELAARSGRPVDWDVAGQHGASVRTIRHRLLPRLGEEVDIVVLLAGVNDVLAQRSTTRWGEELAATIDDLAGRAKQVAVAGIPPFGAFPSLPRALRRHLARHADALDETSRKICARCPRVTWISAADLAPVEPGFFARDRFHPSALGYRRWAQAVADHVHL